jgi:hypothetical protein
VLASAEGISVTSAGGFAYPVLVPEPAAGAALAAWAVAWALRRPRRAPARPPAH